MSSGVLSGVHPDCDVGVILESVRPDAQWCFMNPTVPLHECYQAVLKSTFQTAHSLTLEKVAPIEVNLFLSMADFAPSC